jgi:hypothetical protein
MEIVFFWLALSAIVAIAANTRGRHPGGWFLLAVVLSPLIAGLLLVALPRGNRISNQRPGDGIYFSELLQPQRRDARREREQLQQDRQNNVFRPDGMIGEIPFRYLPGGNEVEAMMQGGAVRFPDLEALRAAVGPDAKLVMLQNKPITPS